MEGLLAYLESFYTRTHPLASLSKQYSKVRLSQCDVGECCDVTADGGIRWEMGQRRGQGMGRSWNWQGSCAEHRQHHRRQRFHRYRRFGICWCRSIEAGSSVSWTQVRRNTATESRETVSPQGTFSRRSRSDTLCQRSASSVLFTWKKAWVMS